MKLKLRPALFMIATALGILMSLAGPALAGMKFP
jgi:hypothetical protein